MYHGDGRLICKDTIKSVVILSKPRQKFYIASDGLYGQIGGERMRPFGYLSIQKIILENHQPSQKIISDKIWEAFVR